MEGKPVVVSACKVRMTPFRPAVPREGTQISEGALVYVTLGSSREQMLCPSQAGGGDLQEVISPIPFLLYSAHQ